MIDFGVTHLLVGVGALLIVLIIVRKQKKSLSYLLCFSVFWIYLIAVTSVIIFPFPLREGYLYPDFKQSINLMPFNFGSCKMINLCLRNIYENILVTIPFGFGISFIAPLKPRDFPWLAFLVGLAFEIIQLIIVFLAGPFRVVDINDVMLNAAGVLLGYSFYRIFRWFYKFITRKFEVSHKHFFAYIYDIVSKT